MSVIKKIHHCWNIILRPSGSQDTGWNTEVLSRDHDAHLHKNHKPAPNPPPHFTAADPLLSLTFCFLFTPNTLPAFTKKMFDFGLIWPQTRDSTCSSKLRWVKLSVCSCEELLQLQTAFKSQPHHINRVHVGWAKWGNVWFLHFDNDPAACWVLLSRSTVCSRWSAERRMERGTGGGKYSSNTQLVFIP